MDRAAFINAIRSVPDDDGPRLIYADWLEEQGHYAHAEFIRVSCEAARLPDTDDRRFACERRAWELLCAHEAEWTADLPATVTDWQWERGVITSVDYDPYRSPESLTETFGLNPLRTYRISMPADPYVLSGSTSLWQRIHEISLHGNDSHRPSGAFLVLDVEPKTLYGMRRLELHGFIPPPQFLSMIHFSRQTQLKELVLRGSAECDYPVNIWLRTIPQSRLEALDLHHVRLFDERFLDLVHLPAVSQLRSLDLSGSPITVIALRALLASPLIEHLRSLKLNDHHSLGDEGARLLATCPRIGSLRELELNATNLSDDGMRALIDSPYLTGLRRLSVNGNALSAASVRALAHPSAFPALEELHGSELNFGHALRELSRSPLLSRLRVFGLNDDALDPGDLGRLLTAPRLARAHTLLLNRNDLRDAGAKRIARARHLTQLTRLEIDGNRIGREGIVALAHAPHLAGLRGLDLGLNRLDLEALRALATAEFLPRLTDLDLRMCGLDWFGLCSLWSQVQGPRWEHLNLHGNRLGDRGARVLAERRDLIWLRSLDLSDNAIGDDGGRALAQVAHWRRLHRLTLTDNSLSTHVIADLHRRFGTCLVI